MKYQPIFSWIILLVINVNTFGWSFTNTHNVSICKYLFRSIFIYVLHNQLVRRFFYFLKLLDCSTTPYAVFFTEASGNHEEGMRLLVCTQGQGLGWSFGCVECAWDIWGELGIWYGNVCACVMWVSVCRRYVQGCV